MRINGVTKTFTNKQVPLKFISNENTEQLIDLYAGLRQDQLITLSRAERGRAGKKERKAGGERRKSW